MQAGGEDTEISAPHSGERRRDAADSVTWGVRIAASWSWRLVVIAVATYIVLRIVSRLSLVIFALIIALFLAAVLAPLERRLRRVLPGPKSIPALIALLIGVAVLVGVGWFVAWQISTHSTQLANQATTFVQRSRDWLRDGPLHLKQADLDKLADNLTAAIRSHQGELVSGAVQTVRTLADVAGAALLVILATFFLLRDGEQIWHWALGFFPRATHARVDAAGRQGWRTVGGYMRGQVLIALFHGVTVTIVLLILRVPLAPALGVVIFLGSFIPLLGLILAGALCVAVALLEHGLTAAIVVAVAITVLAQVEGHVLQPVIMSRTVAIHPLAVVVAVFTGAALAGIPGALIAVPLAAFTNAVVRSLRRPSPDAGTGIAAAADDEQSGPD